MNQKIVKKLEKYFKNREDVAFAFLFGSQAKGIAGKSSDWDIAVYFKPKARELEWENQENDYPQTDQVWSDVGQIVKKEIDLVVLNRSRSTLTFHILRSGAPLIINDRSLYLRLLIRSSYEAMDFYDFIFDFYAIKQRSKSLLKEDRARLLKIIDFMETELQEHEKFVKLSWDEYLKERSKRRDIERWIESLCNALIDASKIILASEKKIIPDTYQNAIKNLHETGLFDLQFTDRLSRWVALRNIIAHEYLDLIWKDIQKFLKEAKPQFEEFINKVKTLI